MTKDILITINVTKMENYLNRFWESHSICTCPSNEHNHYNTMGEIFKILKDFEVKH